MDLTMQEKLKLIKLFEFLMDKEISKPLGGMNPEAVDNYIKILLLLQDKHVELSPEFIDEQVRKILCKKDAVPETEKTTKKQYKKNKIWLVAACVAILVALFSIISFSSEKSVKDVLEDFFGTYISIPFGKEINLGNETYGKESSGKHYDSIEMLVENKKTSLFYPTNAENIKGISIGFVKGKETIDISYIDSDLFITITLNSDIPQEDIDFCNDKLTLNGIEYYLCTMEDVEQVQAYFTHDENMYRITHTDKETLIEILNNMEEIKYED